MQIQYSSVYQMVPTKGIVHSPVSRGVAFLATPYFRVLQSLFFVGYGLKEIIFDGPKDKSSSFFERVEQSVKRCFNEMQVNPFQASFNFQHGLLFMSAGICGIQGAIIQIKKFPCPNLLKVLQHLDFGLFLTACAIALRYNVLKYWEENCTVSQRFSSVMGILSTLSYLIWGALSILGSSTAICLIFMCIGLSTGATKVLYDFFIEN